MHAYVDITSPADLLAVTYMNLRAVAEKDGIRIK
jgi:hypothetical protein